LTFNSVYEMLTPLTQIRSQRFWEWFSGDDIKSYWNFNDIFGTNSGAMSDEVDGGYVITTGATTSHQGAIEFNNKRPFEETGCVGIFVMKVDESTNRRIFGGLSNSVTLGSDYIAIYNDSSTTNYEFQTRQSSVTTVASSVTNDESYHVHKVEGLSSSATGTIDGVLEATNTTNLPTSPLQPIFATLARSASARNGHIKYFEAFNT